MDGPREHHIEWNKSDREREILCDIPYMQNIKRNETNELTYKTETDSPTLRTKLGLQWEEKGWGEGIVREFGTDMHALPHLKWITNKDFL